MQFLTIQPQNPPPQPERGEAVPLMGSAILILAGMILAVYYLNKLRRSGGR